MAARPGRSACVDESVPSQQGLKHERRRVAISDVMASTSRSITTRIETRDAESLEPEPTESMSPFHHNKD